MFIFYSFKITTVAILQIFLLGLCGYVLTKKNIMSLENLKFISRLVVNLFLPCFIFVQLIENFNFRVYANWWIFPLLSFVVTAMGYFCGVLFVKIDKKLESFRKEFISLVTFQNSGYLPLILMAFLLPPGSREQMYIYIFLFLLGFNLIIWSAGVFYLREERQEKFEMSSLLNAPVIAIISVLVLIALGLDKIIPGFLIKPAKMLGDCTLPLAMLVVGGNLAQIAISAKDNSKYILNLVAAKLLLLPLMALGLIFLIRPPYEVAFIFMLQSTLPSATSLGVIMRHYDRSDNIISLGIFWTHVVSLLTVPVFLIVFSALRVLIYPY
ncbi:MAG: AEC family transporter [Candidatus Omnitrophica bacterium]|nr:AEC family transporter [Candidatus Omnitrophota bacterium]MDD5351955.1 AEC family transporter [Candidatus Omnitrophota bacterium]MDD5550781.1 AEC family transporter [Candidatus Omnitrophota bacterium]